GSPAFDEEGDVASERPAGERTARPQVRPWSYPNVALQPALDFSRVGAHPLAENRKLVREGHRGGKERIESMLRHLRGLYTHPFNPVRERLDEPGDAVLL